MMKIRKCCVPRFRRAGKRACQHREIADGRGHLSHRIGGANAQKQCRNAVERGPLHGPFLEIVQPETTIPLKFLAAGVRGKSSPKEL